MNRAEGENTVSKEIWDLNLMETCQYLQKWDEVGDLAKELNRPDIEILYHWNAKNFVCLWNCFFRVFWLFVCLLFLFVCLFLFRLFLFVFSVSGSLCADFGRIRLPR